MRRSSIGIAQMVPLTIVALWLGIPSTSAKPFESKAVVQVSPAGFDLDPRPGAPKPGAAARQKLVANEVALISSDRTLRRAAETLDLAARWKVEPADALERIQKMLKVQPIRGTDLIEIVIRSEDEEEGRKLCIAVANSYQERREAEERDRAKAALDALEAEMRVQEDRVAEKRKLFHKIVREVGIPFIEGKPRVGEGGAGPEALGRAPQLQRDKQRFQVIATTLHRLQGEERLNYARGLDLLDAGAVKSLTRHEEAQRALKSITDSGIAAEHPAHQAQAKRIRDLDMEVAQILERFIQSLEAQVKQLQAQPAVAEEGEARPREGAADEAIAAQDYVEAKQDYEAAKNILQTMKISFASKRIALQIPRSPVTIHELPAER